MSFPIAKSHLHRAKDKAEQQNNEVLKLLCDGLLELAKELEIMSRKINSQVGSRHA